MTRMKLIKNIQIYAPKNLGVKDVLISDSKIEKIDDPADPELNQKIEAFEYNGLRVNNFEMDGRSLRLLQSGPPGHLRVSGHAEGAGRPEAGRSGYGDGGRQRAHRL